MLIDPLSKPCLHLATPEELERDRDYRMCNAGPGEPCCWARRYDGVLDPPFHSERMERAAEVRGTVGAEQGELQASLDTETFREAVLDTGLV